MRARAFAGLLGIGLVSSSCGGGAVSPVAKAAVEPVREGKGSRTELQKQRLLAKAEAVNKNDIAAYADAYSADAQTFDVGPSGLERASRGREAIARDAQERNAKFDVQFELRRAFLRDGVGVIEYAARGRDRAGGREISVRGAHVLRFDGEGRIATEHSYTDQVSIAVQMGAMRGRTRLGPAFGGTTTWVVPNPAALDGERITRVKAAYPTAWSKKDRGAFEGALATEVTFDEVAMPFDVSGKTQAVELMDAYVAGLPDLAVTVDDAWAFDDTVVMAVTLTGTHAGRFFDLEATGKRMSFHALDIVDTRDGAIKRITRYTNRVEWLTQIGYFAARP